MNSVVAVDKVIKIYGSNETRVMALNNVSLTFLPGQFVAIMGPSGSGKSTLLHCAAALDRASSGEITIAGNNITNLSDLQLTKLRRYNIGFVFQAYNLVPTLTAKENILLPLTIARSTINSTWFEQLIEVLDLKNRLNHLPSQLSGGQQQRVAVARALITKPQIIFADEPTGNLDSKSSKQLLEFFQYVVSEYGQAIAMVTHDPKVASYAQKVIFLKDGQIFDELSQPTSDKILKVFDRLGQ